MNWKDLIKAPPAEGYVKNSSKLVTGLLILAGILYYPTKGYGAIVALSLAMFVLMGQKLLISQANKDFADLYQAQNQFKQNGEPDYLRFIQLKANQMLKDNKVLSIKAKQELNQLLAFVEENLAQAEQAQENQESQENLDD